MIASVVISENKSETSMNANVLRQVPNTYKFEKALSYADKIQHANFRGNHFYQATIRHLLLFGRVSFLLRSQFYNVRINRNFLLCLSF